MRQSTKSTPRKTSPKTSKVGKLTVACLIVLAMLAKTVMAKAECEGQCFSASDARNCVQAQQKWQRCKSELVKCDKVEQENDQIAGRLNECRQTAKQRERILSYKSEKVGKLEAKNESLREQNLYYFLGGTAVGSTVVGLLLFVQ